MPLRNIETVENQFGGFGHLLAFAPIVNAAPSLTTNTSPSVAMANTPVPTGAVAGLGLFLAVLLESTDVSQLTEMPPANVSLADPQSIPLPDAGQRETKFSNSDESNGGANQPRKQRRDGASLVAAAMPLVVPAAMPFVISMPMLLGLPLAPPLPAPGLQMKTDGVGPAAENGSSVLLQGNQLSVLPGFDASAQMASGALAPLVSNSANTSSAAKGVQLDPAPLALIAKLVPVVGTAVGAPSQPTQTQSKDSLQASAEPVVPASPESMQDTTWESPPQATGVPPERANSTPATNADPRDRVSTAEQSPAAPPPLTLRSSTRPQTHTAGHDADAPWNASPASNSLAADRITHAMSAGATGDRGPQFAAEGNHIAAASGRGNTSEAHILVPEQPASHAPQPLREITLRIGERAAQQVDVHVTTRADGNVQVALRTGSAELSSRLQSEVPRLAESLHDNGFDSEIWTPANGAESHVQRTAEAQRDDNNGANGFPGNGGQQQSQQEDRRQKHQATGEWQEEIGNLLPGFYRKGEHS